MTQRGAARAFLFYAAAYEGEDCLVWPFGRDSAGYARAKYQGAMHKASRVVCLFAHGEPPNAQDYACHTCGNGHGGCVNGKHLRWGSPKENQSDRIKDGTDGRGERHPMVKLTEADVAIIRALRGVETGRDLAKRFGVAASTITVIQKGRSWRHSK